MNVKKASLPRREFLRTSSAATVAAGAGALTAASHSRVVGANERLRVGCIGVGSRGQGRMRSTQDHGAVVVAICDVNEDMLNQAAKGVRGDSAKRYRYHEEVLARDDVDAVIIASPDHWHRDHVVDAVRAGKDAYLEKPMAHSLEDSRAIVEEVEATDRIVEIGNQRRSGQHWERARELVASGKIGDLRFVRTWDTRYRPNDPYVARAKRFSEKRIDWKRFLGRAPSRPFDPVRCSAWRWFWDYGGGLMTDIGPHRLDVAHWISDTFGPRSVVANGGNYHSPEWETPDNIHALLDCGTFCINFNVHFMNGQDGGGAGYYGTGGTILQSHGVMRHIDTSNKLIAEWPTPGEGELHMKNFLDCVKSRKQPNSPVGVAHKVLAGAFLANEAYVSGRRLMWDAKSERKRFG